VTSPARGSPGTFILVCVDYWTDLDERLKQLWKWRPESGFASSVVAMTRVPAQLASLVALVAVTGCGGEVNGCLSECSGSCAANGRCVETVTSIPNAGSFAIRGASGYLGAEDDGTGTYGSILEVSLGGGAATRLAGHRQPNGGGCRTIAVDETRLYWVENYANIATMPLEGGAVSLLGYSTHHINALALHGSNLYVAEYPASVVQVPVDDSPPTVLAPPLVPVTGPPAVGVAVDDGHAYWSAGTLMKTPLTGGETESISGPFRAEGDVAVDETNAYFYDAESLMKVPLAGGEPVKLADASPSSVAVDARSVYWTEPDRVLKVPIEGGPATVLAADRLLPNCIIVHDMSAYWIEGTGIVRLTPR
jgi:hypothetical protein